MTIVLFHAVMLQENSKTFIIEEKSHIIWQLQNGKLNEDIAKGFVSHSTIALSKNNSLNIKELTISEHQVIEQASLTSFKTKNLTKGQ